MGWANVDRYPDANARNVAWNTFERLADLSPAAIGADTDQFEAIPFLRFDDEAQRYFEEWREGLERKLRLASCIQLWKAIWPNIVS
ncbi:DUF3987 domain-containing protein [Bradyrhizobium jicamae]|uniref:DUF3987 domain-containing protein n=1 Tax=Bradyrhizobium jicamae TaxID=280332 RepID=A0ABS5FYA7_9BRAD|nr:DUF3987 domain-containing protein [Bradyrhizobium jicamae]